MNRIRAVVVDDEALARERVVRLLAGQPDIEIVAECDDGHQAIAAVRDLAPDLLFLDVQMPAINGFGVLEAIAAQPPPAVVFVTAFDRYALRAFEVHALDYLLKPFSAERFEKAVARARAELEQTRAGGEINRRLVALLEDLRADKKRHDRIVVKSPGRVAFLRLDEIDWIEAAGNYVRIHAGQTAHLLRETMKSFEARLDPARFVRIHRSAIVNVDRIVELRPMLHGEHTVILKDGTRLTASRKPDATFRKMLEDA